MKKILSQLVALSLLCAGTALAETQITENNGTGETMITYTVPEPVTSYTVTIPSSVSIPQGDSSATMQISIAADSTLETDKTLSVTLENSGNAFKLLHTSGSDTITYTVSKDSQTLDIGDTVLSWTEGEDIPRAATLTMALAESINGKAAGDYSDTLTFKVSVSD